MAATASPARTLVCPSCRATVTSANRFCPQCGTPLGSATGNPGSQLPPPPPPPPPPGAPVDIRQRVDDDRGVLKRIQLLVPGFRGYRLGEDARDADNYLRLQIADKVHLSVVALERTRQQMSQAGAFQPLTDLAPSLADLMVLEGKIRHAEQGYSGISAPLRVPPERLDRLYEYDYGFVQAADQLATSVGALGDSATRGDTASLGPGVGNVRNQIQQLQNAFQARLQVVEAVRVGS